MPLLKTKHWFIAMSFFILFMLLSIFSFRDDWSTLDQAVSIWVTETVSPFVVTLMDILTMMGSSEFVLVITLIIAVILLWRKRWQLSVFLLSLTFGGLALNFFLKILFQRERPGEMSVIEAFGQSIEIASYSFPSGHTMRSTILFLFAIYMCYRLMSKNVGRVWGVVLFAALIIIVAISRVVVGAHFPSDILAGVAISIVWFYVCLAILRFLLKRMPTARVDV
ncbi:phosphatase PAP2 family protein [Salicibibacter cibarius]|uniref:Phosphatase PAP2 family protein n=1 Tax=Salicibibacter cibarius TaxID=2743000 RepID=A0A7T6Z4J6_9BACI|nr:phosphatase PAP2 family protein [Salicibibacter cibarius]QQK76794.1 phosphatase PAP2 family protein [Salicibibacter cibarius]